MSKIQLSEIAFEIALVSNRLDDCDDETPARREGMDTPLISAPRGALLGKGAICSLTHSANSLSTFVVD